MNSKQIEYVLEVSRTNNFSKAAENLYVTQPALTYSIKTLEDEIGFKIFDRNGKGASITIAGDYFIKHLRNMQIDLGNVIEHSQNLAHQYHDSLVLCLSNRSNLLKLPKIVDLFTQEYPDIYLDIIYIYHSEQRIDALLNGRADLLFTVDGNNKHIPNTTVYPIHLSKIDLVCKKSHPLAKKSLIHEEDLEGETLLQSIYSPKALRDLQLHLLKNDKIHFLNSPDHETSLTYISLNRALNLIPDFLNDHSNEFIWIPYDSKETMSCDLVKRHDDHREYVQRFIEITREVYKGE